MIKDHLFQLVLLEDVMQWSGWLSLLDDQINQIPERSGVYELHTVSELLYIGQSDNLRRRLKEHKNTADPCIKKATIFHYAETTAPNTVEENLLKDYKISHGGKLPPCNEMST